jgi:hypothetical protein
MIPVEVLIKTVLPVIKELITDQSQHVRGTTVCSECCLIMSLQLV